MALSRSRDQEREGRLGSENVVGDGLLRARCDAGSSIHPHAESGTHIVTYLVGSWCRVRFEAGSEVIEGLRLKGLGRIGGSAGGAERWSTLKTPV